jgi:hypothetical protein
MILSQIVQKIYNLTDSNSGNYTAAQMLPDINSWYQRIVNVILRSQDDWEFDDSNKTDYPILTGDLVANQQSYVLPAGCLRIQRLELSYDGSITFYKAEPIDVSMISKGTQPAQILQWANVNRPYYDIRYSSIFLYPIPTVTTTGSTGMKIWINRNITEFTSSDLSTGTASPGFDPNFHMLLAYGVAHDRAIAKSLANADRIDKELDKLMSELSTYYGNKDEDMAWSIQPAYEDYGQLNYQTGNIRRIR